jgi:hypothetical protein
MSGRQRFEPSHSGGRELAGFARLIRRSITLIAFGLGSAFTWVQLKDLRFGSVISSVDPDTTRQILLAIYYWCWVYGAKFDVDIQEAAFSRNIGAVREVLRAIAFIVVFGIVAGILFLVSKNDQTFAVALTLFLLSNIAGFFLYILPFVKPLFDTSRREFAAGHNYTDLVLLEVVYDYMYGRWQWFRFAVGLGLVCFILLISFSNYVREGVSVAISDLVPSLFDFRTVYSDAPSLSFLVFVCVMEAWIYLMRFKVQISLQVIERLVRDYHLEIGRARRRPSNRAK